MNKNIYEIITNKIIEKLKKGTVPWQKPWAGNEELPKNLITKKPYRGINTFLLACTDYTSPFWLTYTQARLKGGYVKKGETGTPVIFWKWIDNKENKENKSIENTENNNKKPTPILRHYTVFNVLQCNNIDIPKIKTSIHNFNVIDKCEKIVKNMPNAPKIKNNINCAFYLPVPDVVNMPSPNKFIKSEKYYSTLFHELVHATGNKTRLGRASITNICKFGSTNYSKEELIAEMGASFLCNYAGIENETIDNSCAYIHSWLKKLKNNKKLLIMAAANAQKACDYILNNN